MTNSTVTIVSADESRRVETLQILLSQFPADERDTRLQDTLQAVERGSLSLQNLWMAKIDERPAGAALVMAQADGVSLIWLPVILDAANELTIRQKLMDVICRELDRSEVKFGQVLLSQNESDEAAWLADYGFELTAELFFLARSLEEPVPEENIPSKIAFEVFDDRRNEHRFQQIIEQTYRESLDCPRLNGSRTGAEAIAGHRLSGVFHPRGWKIYRQDGRDAAVLLLNEHPDQDAVELVYFGVVPEFRGEGWGEEILKDAIAMGRAWNRAVIFLAVDAANSFANRIYAEFGFQEVARRVVWLRFPRGSARK